MAGSLMLNAASAGWEVCSSVVWNPCLPSVPRCPCLAMPCPALPNIFCSPTCLMSALQLVFALVSVGAIVLTINVVLLGGTIGFFQSLCLLGYCLFPMDVAAIVCVTVDLMLVRCEWKWSIQAGRQAGMLGCSWRQRQLGSPCLQRWCRLSSWHSMVCVCLMHLVHMCMCVYLGSLMPAACAHCGSQQGLPLLGFARPALFFPFCRWVSLPKPRHTPS